MVNLPDFAIHFLGPCYLLGPAKGGGYAPLRSNPRVDCEQDPVSKERRATLPTMGSRVCAAGQQWFIWPILLYLCRSGDILQPLIAGPNKTQHGPRELIVNASSSVNSDTRRRPIRTALTSFVAIATGYHPFRYGSTCFAAWQTAGPCTGAPWPAP